MEARRKILDIQDHRCYWCGRKYGSYLLIKTKRKDYIHRISIVWDHYIPYVYTGDNRDDEFVASCQKCNAFKHTFLVYENEDEIREYLHEKWKKVKYRDITSPLHGGRIKNRCVYSYCRLTAFIRRLTWKKNGESGYCIVVTQ